MTKRAARLTGLATDLEIGLTFCTRFPTAHSAAIEDGDLARASWAFPVVGALLGAGSSLVYWSAARLGLPPGVGAALAIVATMVATGGLHEDGLADTADGFGGGRDRVRKLEIMRDSRIGTYGTCALVMAVLLRWSALTSIEKPAFAALALMASHGAARAALPIAMRFVISARPDGLSAGAGRPSRLRTAAAGLFGAALLVLTLGPGPATIAFGLMVVTGLLMARLCVRQIGGLTGDVLGALEQIDEIVILLVAAALWSVQP